MEAVKIHTPTIRHKMPVHPDPLHSEGLGLDAGLPPLWALGAAATIPRALATLLFLVLCSVASFTF